MSHFRNTLLLVLIVFTFVSCATNPAMETFPQRRIDRTPHKTAGVSSWGTMVVGRKTLDHYGKSSELTPTVLPVFYSFHALDNILVDGAFFPNQMAIQVLDDKVSDSTVDLGFQFSSEDYIGDVVDGSLGFSRRSYLSEQIVVGTSISVGHLFYFNDGPQNFTLEVMLKPEVQIGDILWIRPGVGFRTESQGAFSGSSGNIHYYSKERLDFLFPVTLDASLSIVKYFEIIGKYSLDFLGEKDGSYDQKYQLGGMLYF